MKNIFTHNVLSSPSQTARQQKTLVCPSVCSSVCLFVCPSVGFLSLLIIFRKYIIRRVMKRSIHSSLNFARCRWGLRFTSLSAGGFHFLNSPGPWHGVDIIHARTVSEHHYVASCDYHNNNSRASCADLAVESPSDRGGSFPQAKASVSQPRCLVPLLRVQIAPLLSTAADAL